MEELKPCPFCGGEAKLRRAGVDRAIICTKCCAAPFWEHTDERAIELWNRRVSNATD